MFRCQFFMAVKPTSFAMNFRNKDLRSKGAKWCSLRLTIEVNQLIVSEHSEAVPARPCE